MKVLCRSKSGEWVEWRVGRRRMVWFGGGPTGLSVFNLHGVDGEVWVLLAIPVLLWWLLRITVCLLATAVVWPIRAILGRWTVVAYEVGDPTDRPEIRRKVRGRKAADALAREWAAVIERDGTLDPTLAGVVPAPPAAPGHGRPEH
ncbi:hypothetical protein [Actinoplanes xinjiangensis]|uniref:Uncharacterized protein n=1 Tax=Actinoplanes xinjiangensis TaxID=512350 RepID=A0A316FHX1_9ACTN|nr:hypothetical protein [Actinoplanes xinjiangensis]PWK47702.1 hypothetical protein BC793_107312 [Actinoplanes xinjiangensis]GIF39367.1 hypothetical protein Axi01nite_36780 [Actinoplanes xinjiangensis]